MKISDIRPEVFAMAERAEARCEKRFREIERVAEQNTLRVMAAFQDQRVSDACFAGTTGYGYDDLGRDTPRSSAPKAPWCGSASSTARTP